MKRTLLLLLFLMLNAACVPSPKVVAMTTVSVNTSIPTSSDTATAIAIPTPTRMPTNTTTPTVTITPSTTPIPTLIGGGTGRIAAILLQAIGASYLYTMNIDGTDLVALTKQRGTVDGALWSPDGKRIAYLFSKYGMAAPDNKIPRYTNLYVVNTDGSGIVQLTNNSVNAYINGFTWSPDSKRIAFALSTGDSNVYDIFVINSDGSGLKKLTDSHSTISPAWSPKGDQIAFVSFLDGIPHNTYHE